MFSFITYMKQIKKNVQKSKYDMDLQYRAVLFHKFGESYRLYCEKHDIQGDYERIAKEINAYEKRIQDYRNS